MTPVLEIEGLEKRRGDARSGFRLELSSLRLFPGDALAVTGPSGCGKSTLLDCVGLALRPDKTATHRLMGEELSGLSEAALGAHRARHIGYILQTGGLLPFATVEENIRLSLNLLGRDFPDHDRAELIDALGLGGLMAKRPAQLSIGERQRAAIARALAHRPPLLLADEPTASLDPSQARAVVELMLSLAKKRGQAVMIVSHDWDLLADFNLARLEARVGVDPQSARPSTRFGP